MRGALVVALALALLSCGDAEKPAEPPPASRPQAEAAEPAAMPEAPATPVGLAAAPEWAAPRPGVSRPAVLLLGIDGAEWEVLDPLFGAGYLPNLARLVREGARAELDCVPAMPETACFCPPVWLTVATGVSYDGHSISTLHHEVRDRTAQTLWQRLHAAGGSSTLVSYRNTWPPEESARYVMTEYGLDWAAGEILRRLPKEKPLIRNALALQRFKPVDLLEQLGLIPHEGPKLPSWKMVARDRVAMEALLRLARKDRTDLTVALVHSPDKAQHLGWAAVQATPESPFDAEAVLAQARAWRGPVRSAPGVPGTNVASQYLETDAWLGRLLADVPYDYIVVASDHGMTRNPGEGLPGHHGIDSPEGHQGVLVIWGPGVRSGTTLAGVDVLDVAPTVAHLLGLAVGEDLPGDVLVEAFDEGWRAEHPVTIGESWN